MRLQIPRQRSLEEIDDPAVAESYDRISRLPQFRFLRRLFVSELQAYRPHGTLIDIGCGPGYLLRRLARAFPELKLMGIDLSPEMIAAAERNLATIRPEGRIEFRTGDIQALPLSDSSIDFAVSSLSLHHWSDPLQALGEVYRVLKPGGQMLLLDLRRDVRRWFYGLFRFATAFIVPAPLRKAHEPLGSLLSSYTPAELRALLAQAPFSEWSVRGGPLWVWVWVRR